MKKLLSLVLIVATLASLVVFVPTVGAAEADVKAIVETTNAAAKPGDTVTVDLYVTAKTAEGMIDGIMLNFHYDRTRLELVMNGELNAEIHGAGSPSNGDNGEALYPWNGDDGKGKYGVEGDTFALFENVSMGYQTGVDMSEGYRAATLTFKVKDDAPIGDAFVEFCHVGGKTFSNVEYNSVVYGEPGEIEYRASKITVLPENYISLVPTDASNFVFDVADGEATILEYTGEDLYVVIPEVDGEGNPVVAIAVAAFRDSEIESLIVPATVQYIACGAAGNCYNLKTVYLLGDVEEYESGAIGWEGRYRNSNGALKFTANYIALNDAGDAPVTTIYIPAGSTLGDNILVEEDDGEFALPYATTDGYRLAVNGVNCLAPASTTAPGVGLTEDGKTIIAWKNGSDTVLAGAPMTLAADTVLEPVAVSMATNTTHSMKLSADTKNLGMRFTSTLSYADYAAMVSLAKDGKQDFVKLGMIITPNQYVERAGAFTKAALSTIGVAENRAYVDVAINGYYEKDDVNEVYTLAASLVGYTDKTLANNIAFAAVTYAEIDTNGDGNADITVYGQYDLATVRSVKDVALSVKNATYPEGEGLTGEQIGWLDTLLGKIGPK